MYKKLFYFNKQKKILVCGNLNFENIFGECNFFCSYRRMSKQLKLIKLHEKNL